MINIDHFHIQCFTDPNLRIDIIFQYAASQIVLFTGYLRYRIPGIRRRDKYDPQIRISLPQFLYNTADRSAIRIFIIRIRHGLNGIPRVIIIQSGSDKQNLYRIKIDLPQVTQRIFKIISCRFPDPYRLLHTEILYRKRSHQSCRRQRILGISQSSLRIRSSQNRSAQSSVITLQACLLLQFGSNGGLIPAQSVHTVSQKYHIVGNSLILAVPREKQHQQYHENHGCNRTIYYFYSAKFYLLHKPGKVPPRSCWHHFHLPDDVPDCCNVPAVLCFASAPSYVPRSAPA